MNIRELADQSGHTAIDTLTAKRSGRGEGKLLPSQDVYTRWSYGDRIGLPCWGSLVRYPLRSVCLSTVLQTKDLSCR